MRKTGAIFLIGFLTIFSGWAIAAAPNHLVLENKTIHDGQVLEYYAYETLQAGPAFVVESGGDVKLRSSGTITLQPGFRADQGSKLLVEIVAEPPNIAPVASAVSISTPEDIPADIPFSATDEDGDTLTFQFVSGPFHGHVEGSFPNAEYIPDADFFGTDTFEYKANDGRSDSNTAVVTVTVDPINDPPSAQIDSYSINEDNTLTANAPAVLENDTDVEGASLSAILVSGVSHGALQLNANGSFEYVPSVNFHGTDSFTYKASDGFLESAPTTVNITVNSINDAPAASGQSVNAIEDTNLQVTLTASDVDGDDLSYSITTPPQHGSVQGTPPALTYIPNANYFGTDSFVFSANDGNGGTDTAVISISIAGINDSPTAILDNYSMHLNTTYTVPAPGVLGNDNDPENDPLSAVLVSNVSHGSLQLNSNGSFSYTPVTDFQGTDSFTYKISDGSLEFPPVSVSIRVTVKPVAYPQTLETDEDTDKTITLTGDDQFNNPITYTIISDPDHGTYSGTLPNITYHPAQDYNGADTISFKVNNGMEDSDPAIVYFKVSPVNDTPVAVGDTVATNEDTAVTTVNVLLNDTDVENDTLSVVSFTQPPNGSVVYNDDGTFTYTPDLNYAGTDTFTYRVSDQNAQSDPATVTVTVAAVDDAPIADAKSFSTSANTSLTITLTGSDVENDPLEFELVSSPQNGTLEGTPPNLTYTPAADTYGDDSFQFRAKTGTVLSEPATIAIHVKTPLPVISFTGSTALVKAGGLATLSWSVQWADQGVTLTPGIGSVPTADSRDVFPDQTTTYTLTATGEGGTATKTVTVEVDDEAPNVETFQPTKDQNVNLEALNTGLLVVFTDNTGIGPVKIYQIIGENEIDKTDLAVFSANSVTLDISSLENGTYRFKVVITDTVGNETIQFLDFTVDKVLPETTPSVPAGEYAKSFTVNLECSESATIFYSIDGSPPAEGLSNTVFGTEPINNITIDHSLNLQFFAKDTFGNIEPVQSVVYTLGKLPNSVSGLTAQYNNDPNVALTWDAAPDAKAYRVYRALSKVDIRILEDSIKGGYAPPQRLRIAEVTSPAYTDAGIVPGMTYFYGVSQVDTDDMEGVLSSLISKDIPEGSTAVDKNQAIQRAMAWLEKVQNEDGSWGQKESIRMLATAQVLNSYSRYGKDDLNTRYALFYLRGHKADNSDFLSRKILALDAYGQNTDLFANLLISQANYSSSYIQGWGINSHYYYDALDSALGKKALACYTKVSSVKKVVAYRLKTNQKLPSYKSEADPAKSDEWRFGWTADSGDSIYVSSLVYKMVDDRYPESAPYFDSTWINDSQVTNANGSFGNGLIDTSGALLWMSGLTEQQITDAAAFLVQQQNPNGSWNNDPYITGLCLEALLK